MSSEAFTAGPDKIKILYNKFFQASQSCILDYLKRITGIFFFP